MKNKLFLLLCVCLAFPVSAAIETIVNGETVGSVQNKINGNFTELDQRATAASSAISTLQTTADSLEARTTTLEGVTARWKGELSNSHWPGTGVDLSGHSAITHSFQAIDSAEIVYSAVNQSWALPSGRYQVEFSALYLPTSSNGQLEVCLIDAADDSFIVCQRHSYSPFDLYQDIASTVQLSTSLEGGKTVKLVYSATCEGASVAGFGRLSIQRVQ